MKTPALPCFHFDGATLAERNGRLRPDQRLEFTVQDLADDCWVSHARMERALVEAGLLHRRGVPTFTALASGLAAMSCTLGPADAPHTLPVAVFCRAAIDCTDVVPPTPALRMSVSDNVFEAATRLIGLLSDITDQLGLRVGSSGPLDAARARALGLAPDYVAQLSFMLSPGAPTSLRRPARFPLPTSALHAPLTARQASEGLRRLRRMTRPLIHVAAHQRLADHAEAADLLLRHLEEGWAAWSSRRPASGGLAARALSAPSPGR